MCNELDYQDKVAILLDEARGIYIPHAFVTGFDLNQWGIDENSDDVEICTDPEHEWYWEAWNSICDNAQYKDGDHTWYLYQSGDLWAVRDDMTEDEWDVFAG